jgi:hypothetical protein
MRRSVTAAALALLLVGAAEADLSGEQQLEAWPGGGS